MVLFSIAVIRRKTPQGNKAYSHSAAVAAVYDVLKQVDTNRDGLLQWEEFWYEYLIPWVHYVPLAADGSDGDAVLDFLEAHPEEAKAIAENGRQFVLQRLRMQDVQGAQQSHLPPPSS